MICFVPSIRCIGVTILLLCLSVCMLSVSHTLMCWPDLLGTEHSLFPLVVISVYQCPLSVCLLFCPFNGDIMPSNTSVGKSFGQAFPNVQVWRFFFWSHIRGVVCKVQYRCAVWHTAVMFTNMWHVEEDNALVNKSLN